MYGASGTFLHPVMLHVSPILQITIEMDTKTKYCIFCFKKNSEISFSREHIIPQNVGGNLFVDEVCVNCNSNLGRLIDTQILKYPEILEAFENLKIPCDKAGILKNYFELTAKSENLEIPAYFQNGMYKMLPKNMPDGSILFPEEKYKSNLAKIIERDSRTKKLKLTQEYLKKEIDKIFKKYSKAKPNEIVDGSSVGRSVIKRRDKFKIIVKPKGNCEIERLIAKIYYEFLYFIEGRFIFHNAKELNPVFELIDKGKKNKSFHFSRQKPKFKIPIESHLIRFIFRENYQELYISFFGILDFSFMTFFHYKGFWTKHEELYKCSNIVGIHFEQNLKKGNKNFWFIDNNSKLLFAFSI